ncbi:Predicted transcriptional regulator [sediment metagenome]|uniref:Predicted transcriptional regulator n=1 Tax=sediment metagenome TaxID=749907 RepID=D9PJC9_9ZZZZ
MEQLSKLEQLAYNELLKNKMLVFKPLDLSRLLGMKIQKTYNLIKSLKKKKVINTTGKRFLSLKNTDEFVIAPSINPPSYISFLTALNYYNFSDETPKMIFLVTTKQSKQIKNFRYVTFSKKRFFGYHSVGNIVIAQKEKAIIDSLLIPKYSGGIKEIIRCLDSSIETININKLIDYAIQMQSKAVNRRLGYIIEKGGYKTDLNKLKKRVGKGYELLDPSLKRKNNFNKTWLLDINI